MPAESIGGDGFCRGRGMDGIGRAAGESDSDTDLEYALRGGPGRQQSGHTWDVTEWGAYGSCLSCCC